MPEKCNFVQVRLIKPDGILSLCEVEVHGKKLDYYEDEGRQKIISYTYTNKYIKVRERKLCI